MDNTYTISDIKRIITPIAQKYNIGRVYLFGSYARGDYDEESDIDFRIDAENIKTLVELGRVYIEFDKAFNKRIDLLPTDSATPEFLKHIATDEVLLYEQ